MEFLNTLAKRSQNIKPEVVTLNKDGLKVEVMMPLLSHRTKIIQNERAQDKKIYSFLVVAYCISEKGVRQSDVLDIDEIIQGLDHLTEDEFMTLYEKCQELSKTSIKDVEDAQKN